MRMCATRDTESLIKQCVRYTIHTDEARHTRFCQSAQTGIREAERARTQRNALQDYLLSQGNKLNARNC